jgi:cytoskeleton protein RodZ
MPAPAGVAGASPVTAPVAAAASVPASAPQRVATGDAPLTLRALQPTWVSARDGNGTLLLSRLLERGESVALGGTMPLRVTVGNAAGTELAFRGQKIDLPARTKDNVARLELQ